MMRCQGWEAWRNRPRLQQGENGRQGKDITLTAVIPITGAAGRGARDRIATSEAELGGFALDKKRTNDRG